MGPLDFDKRTSGEGVAGRCTGIPMRTVVSRQSSVVGQWRVRSKSWLLSETYKVGLIFDKYLTCPSFIACENVRFTTGHVKIILIPLQIDLDRRLKSVFLRCDIYPPCQAAGVEVRAGDGFVC